MLFNFSDLNYKMEIKMAIPQRVVSIKRDIIRQLAYTNMCYAFVGLVYKGGNGSQLILKTVL